MTGQHPAVPEKEPAVQLTFDRALSLIAIVGMLCGIAGTYAVMQDRVEVLRGEVSQLRTSQAADHEAHQAQATDIALLKSGLVALTSTLNEVKGDVKDIKNSVATVNFANGRDRR